jgi:hypothetical protein
MTVKNLLLFVTWRERYEEADQGLAFSRRLRELLETTERDPARTHDQNVPTTKSEHHVHVKVRAGARTLDAEFVDGFRAFSGSAGYS